jgi:hypothetical protein
VRNIILFVVILFVGQTSLVAQGAAANHVFPQIADGVLGTGYYNTVISAVNINVQPATCTLRFYGFPLNRLQQESLPIVTLPSQGSFALWETSGDGALATGYATLACDRPVAAVALYIYSSPDHIPTSVATVYSSPATTRAQVVAVQEESTRTALALANDTDSVGQYTIAVTDVSTGQVKSANVSVPARSNIAKFVNEIVPGLPDEFLGSVVITGPSTFSVMSLVYIGSVFYGIPPTIY